MKDVSQDSSCDQCMDSLEAFTEPSLQPFLPFAYSMYDLRIASASSARWPAKLPARWAWNSISEVQKRPHLLAGKEVEP